MTMIESTTEPNPKKDNPLLRLMRASIVIQQRAKADTTGYKYKYCTIQTLLKISILELGKNQLGLKQYFKFYNNLGASTIVTEIIDIDTKEVIIQSELPLANTEGNTHSNNSKSAGVDKNINQEVGATLTYYRRYSLYCVLSIQPEEDKDGSTDNFKYQKAQEKKQEIDNHLKKKN